LTSGGDPLHGECRFFPELLGMCGIVGLFIKDSSLELELGRLTAGMLATMSDRGPDSAGFAVYGEGEEDHTKFTLRGKSAADIKETTDKIARVFDGAKITLHDSHAVVGIDDSSVRRLTEWLARESPSTEIVGTGHRMELYKEVGRPEKVATASILLRCAAPTRSATTRPHSSTYQSQYPAGFGQGMVNCAPRRT
jgi:glutamate synthase domain-containing protein 1